jgi:uncharacterized membrane protein YdfJ with MMPL/SSD domain
VATITRYCLSHRRTVLLAWLLPAVLEGALASTTVNRLSRNLAAPEAVIVNVVSFGASFGFLVLFWQNGHGSNLTYGAPATGAIQNWVPVVAFASLFGILVDALIVRTLLVPAFVAVMGRWNWWMPTPLARLSRIEEPGPPTVTRQPVDA